jgi:hypothetical protein
MLTSTPMLALVTIGCGYRLFTRDWQQEGDREGLIQYLGLLAALSIVVVLTAGAAAHGAISGSH